MTRAIHKLAPITSLIWLTSCGPDAGEASFEVAQVMLQSDCMRRAFPFDPVDLRAQHNPASTTLFFQDNPAPLRRADLLTIDVQAADPTAQPVPLRIARNPAPQPSEPAISTFMPPDVPAARADLQLLKSCPLLDESFILEGELTFTEFGRMPGEQITGSITARILEARSGATVAEQLTGTFSFTIDHGRTSENLYDARRDAEAGRP
jgi:hypothetical protein